MTTKPSLPSLGMLGFFVVCALAMVWPGALIANRIEPMVMGLPFFLFWYIAWVFVIFAGLVLFYRAERAQEVDDE